MVFADSGSDIQDQRDRFQRGSYLKNVHTTIVIALYNLGVEYEHLSDYGQAIENFNRALFLNQEHLGRDSHMTKIISEGLQSVLLKHQKKMHIVHAYGGGGNGGGF